jgi:hypothetical protein
MKLVALRYDLTLFLFRYDMKDKIRSPITFASSVKTPISALAPHRTLFPVYIFVVKTANCRQLPGDREFSY